MTPWSITVTDCEPDGPYVYQPLAWDEGGRDKRLCAVGGVGDRSTSLRGLTRPEADAIVEALKALEAARRRRQRLHLRDAEPGDEPIVG